MILMIVLILVELWEESWNSFTNAHYLTQLRLLFVEMQLFSPHSLNACFAL